MNPIHLLLLTGALYVFSILVLRYIGRTVPIVLIGLPVILAGLATIGVLSALSFLHVAPGLAAVGALLGFIFAFRQGCDIAVKTISEFYNFK